MLKTMSCYVVLVVTICWIAGVRALREGFDEAHITKCELDALRLGSGLADTFTSLTDSRDWNERMSQNFILKHLGFAPWNDNGVKGTGKSLSGSDTEKLRKTHGWKGKDTKHSPYAVLEGKWVYMFGDSTLRQVWASYAAAFQGNTFERNAKEWTRQYCNKQANRVTHDTVRYYEEEGWEGPCGKNEVTCYVSGYGPEGLLTFDWKHFPYEDYDDYLFGNNGIFNANPKVKQDNPDAGRKPDILTLQTGLHTCFHAYPNKHDTRLKPGYFNETMYKAHVKGLDKLFKTTREAVNRRADDGDGKPPTMVVVVTSGSVVLSPDADKCVLRFNHEAVKLAHKYGFAVLHRGEIERRLLYNDVLVATDMHLPMPAQTIVATSMLNLFTCLSSDPEKLGIEPFAIHIEGGSNIQPNLYSAPSR